MRIKRKKKRTISKEKRNNQEGAVIRQENVDPTPWQSDILQMGTEKWGDMSGESQILVRVRKNMKETFNSVRRNSIPVPKKVNIN